MDLESFPDLAKQPVVFINGTPDDEYPIRILEAYLANTECRWATDTSGNCDNPLFELMNKHCEERAEILRKAIATLRKQAD